MTSRELACELLLRRELAPTFLTFGRARTSVMHEPAQMFFWNSRMLYAPAGDVFAGSVAQHRYVSDPGYTFIREEVQSFNDGWTHYESDERRAELEAQMPTYRPSVHPLRGIRPGA